MQQHKRKKRAAAAKPKVSAGFKFCRKKVMQKKGAGMDARGSTTDNEKVLRCKTFLLLALAGMTRFTIEKEAAFYAASAFPGEWVGAG